MQKSQLFAFLGGDRPLGAAHKDIGRDANRAEFLDRVLRWLCLEFTAGLDEGQKRQMHENALSTRLFLAELADRFEKGQAFDIADGAADLTEHEVDLILADADEIFDFIGDMLDDLDGFAQVVAAALFFQDAGIDPTR